MPQTDAAPIVIVTPAEPAEIREADLWKVKFDERAGAAQKFFEDYATKIRAPHYGPTHKAVIEEMLIRAQEQHLYTPKE